MKSKLIKQYLRGEIIRQRRVGTDNHLKIRRYGSFHHHKKYKKEYNSTENFQIVRFLNSTKISEIPKLLLKKQ